jgi:hypothetical protein
MEKSKLEGLSDRMLSQFFVQLSKLYDGDLENSDYSPLADDSSFRDDCDSVSTIFGLGQCDWIDLDYIITLIDMNPSISEGIINKRPKVDGYTYEIDVHETVSQRLTYKHTSTSYSPNTLLQIVEVMQNEGDISPWDGEQIDTDIYDSDTNDVKLDKTSVRKIR